MPLDSQSARPPEVVRVGTASRSPASTGVRPTAASLGVAAAARVRLFVPSRAWGGRRRREILFAAAVTAVLFHVLVTLLVLRAPRLWPMQPHPPAQATGAGDPPTLEMIMDKNRYSGGAQQTPPAPQAPPKPPAPKAPQTPDAPTGSPADTSQVLSSPNAKDSVSVGPDPGDQAPKPQPQTAPTPPDPQVDLDPSDALGYGMQDDPHLIPASPDNRNANKMPAYPRAAGRRGEEGQVQVLVMIGADGRVQNGEIAVSSGHPDLDGTALKAVRGWHFHPSMRNGQPVAATMMQIFNFHIDR